jgi:hypothetical protein
MFQAYQECVDTCIKAIEVGRENRADFKLIAKAMARMGKAYTKLNDLYNAKSAYEKALTEHRTPEYRTALSEVESLIKKKEAEDYINPEIAEQVQTSNSAENVFGQINILSFWNQSCDGELQRQRIKKFTPPRVA